MASSSGGVPPGFRFHPTDEELLHYYLKKKLSFQKFDMEVIREVDLNKLEPWDLQERCRIGSTPQNEWYFFSHKDRKYPTGSRTNRATNAGFWKATGRDKCIRNTFKKIGMRKTLVFYRGRAPHGQKTDWIMHEYRLEEQDHDPNLNSSSEDGWVVCRVFKKKNLFKVGSSNDGGGGGGGSSTINSEITTTTHHQYLNSSNTNNTNYTTSHNNMQVSTQYYLLRQPPHNLMQQQPPTFELNNKPPPPQPPPPPYHELALHYPPHTHLDHLHHYSQPPLIPNAYGPVADSNLDVHAKQLMIANAAARADCESGSDVSGALRGYQLCEPGLEVGTSTQQNRDHHQDQDQDHDHDQQQANHHQAQAQAQAGMTEWPTMLERIVSPSAENNNDAVLPSASVSARIHHLSLRATTSSATGEMDFWGYAK